MKAAAQSRLSDMEAVVTTCGEVVDRFGGSENPEMQLWVARALMDKSEALKQDNPEAAASACDEVVARFGASEDPRLQWLVARALVEKSEALKQDSPEAAASACDEVIARFGVSDSPELLWWVAWALTSKGHMLKARGELSSALSAYQEVAKRFDAAVEPDLRVRASFALSFIGSTLAESNRLPSAISAFDKSLEIADSIDPLTLPVPVASALQTLTAMARMSKSAALQAQGNLQSAIDSFRSGYAVFEPGNEEVIRGVLDLLIEFIAAGVDVHTILEIISSNDHREDALRPFILALQQEAGEAVHAPRELLEVAADIRKQIREKQLQQVATTGAVSCLPGDG